MVGGCCRFFVVFFVFSFSRLAGRCSSVLVLQPDMMMLMRAVLVGASRVGITKSQPDGKETRELAHMAFDGADVNSDEQVTLGEFEPWAQGQIESQRLWLKFGFQPAREDVGLKAISSNNTRAVLRSRMPHDRRSSLQARMAHTKVEQSKELVKEKGDSHVPASLLANKDFLEVKRLDTKARARKLITIATRCVHFFVCLFFGVHAVPCRG